MNQDNISDKLKSLLANAGGKYNIMEEQIDINLQIEFFELFDKLTKENSKLTDIHLETEKLFNNETTIEEQKNIIAKLSDNETPEAYRTIERFIISGNKKLKDWSILALQHCRINLECHLLDEHKIFISTGLGGKNNKLRFFFVCKLKVDSNITKTQKRLVQTEFEFSFKKNSSKIEKIKYFDKYFSVLGLIPIDISVNEIIKKAIKELNNYGGFIYDKYLVTNIKILNLIEIENYFKNKGI
jgi:hypothetical protein